MPDITVRADCSNSPQKALLRDLNIAFARADVDGILALFTEDISWRIVGQLEMRGREQARDVLMQMRDVKVRLLTIETIIVEGRDGVISGVIAPESGSSVAFCDICRFGGAGGDKIESMTSYTVELTAEA